MADPGSSAPRPVHELRLVVTVDDYDAAVAFYRDALGLRESSPSGARPTAA